MPTCILPQDQLGQCDWNTPTPSDGYRVVPLSPLYSPAPNGLSLPFGQDAHHILVPPSTRAKTAQVGQSKEHPSATLPGSPH